MNRVLKQHAAKRNRDIFLSLGITLSIAGINCMGIVKGLIGSNLQMLSIAVVVISVILLAIGQQFGCIITPTAEVGLIFLYSIATLLMCLFSGIPLMKNGYGFIYQAAIFAQIWLLWNMDSETDTDLYVEVGFWICGIFCMISLILLLKNSAGSLFINSFTSADGEYLFNRTTIGALSFRSFSMALAYKPESLLKKRIRFFFIFVSLVVIVASSRRGVYLATIACILLYLRNNRKRTSGINIDNLLKQIIVAGVVGVILFMVYTRSVYVQEALDHAWKMLVEGVQTFLGVNNSDMSASMRVNKSRAVIDQFFHNSTFVQTLFGRGYMTTWIDMPYIQAFWDLGLIGGTVYCIIQFAIPLKYLAKKANSQGFMAAQYLAALSVFEGVANGFPYGRFFMIMLLITMYTIAEKAFEVGCTEKYEVGKP